MMRWLTIRRSTRRAIETTMPGKGVAIAAPTAMAPRMGAGRKAGVSGTSSFSFFAATARSSGRTTPSTNPTVKSRPFGSLSTPANRAADAFTGYAAASLTQRRTSSTTGAARSWGRITSHFSRERMGKVWSDRSVNVKRTYLPNNMKQK